MLVCSESGVVDWERARYLRGLATVGRELEKGAITWCWF